MELIKAFTEGLEEYFVRVRDDNAVRNIKQAISALKPY